eukprot:3287555-Amphidinium_carterae.1
MRDPPPRPRTKSVNAQLAKSTNASTYFRMVAEHELHNELAEQIDENHLTEFYRATYSRAGEPSLSVNDSLLAVGPPRLASTGTSTLTTTSTSTDGIYMLSAPKQQFHRREALTMFESNNKPDATAKLSTTFKNWASTLQIYMSLKDRNLIDIMDNIRRETIPISNDASIEH